MGSSDLFNLFREVFLKWDLEGLYTEDEYGANVDEYDSEITKIIRNLAKCETEKEFAELVYGVFAQSFADLMQPREVYAEMAKEIWSRMHCQKPPLSDGD